MKSQTLYRELFDAYLKFKSYVYHENFSIALKKDVAVFEANFQPRMSNLSTQLEAYIKNNHSAYIDNLMAEVGFNLIPKKFEADKYDEKNGTFYTNKNLLTAYRIDNIKKITPFISCPIELHILATLWVTRIGVKVDSNLHKRCFANRLYDLKHFKKIDPLRLYKRFYFQYNKWRDSATKAAKELHSKGNNVAILSLDIESYYHSIDFDLSKLIVTRKYKWLNQLLIRLHGTYNTVLQQHNLLAYPERRILPIGLITSNILANLYLRDLDAVVSQQINPAYYGRYVDDFLIVFSNPNINEASKDVIPEFIDQNLVIKTTAIRKTYIAKGPDGTYLIYVNNNQLRFQLSKVRLYYFKSSDSVDLLEEFEREIKRNSSEFRLQLEEEELKNPFEESIYQINYSDTINKLRSVDGFTHNKFGASKQLSKIIATVKYIDTEEPTIKHLSDKINEYFVGKRCLELHSLWEKAFSYYVITKDSIGLLKLSKQVLQAIARVKVNIKELDKPMNEQLTSAVIAGLMEHLKNSYAAAAALNIKFFNTDIINKIRRQTRSGSIEEELESMTVISIRKIARDMITANMLKHSYCFYPLLNYCKQHRDYAFDSPQLTRNTSFELDKNKVRLSPRFINFHEVELFHYLKYCVSGTKPPPQYVNQKYFFNRSVHLKLNSSTYQPNTFVYFRNYRVHQDKHHSKFFLDPYKKLEDVTIGLVNIKVDSQNNTSALQGKPVLSLDRLNVINRILNAAVKNKVDIVIFPEISIPFQWVSKLADYSKKNNIGIVCGLEHITNKKEAFNYVCTLLPFRDGYYFNTFIDLRLKIDYSPGEVEELTKMKLIQPKASKAERMRLYKWRDVCFTVFNCFELTDIEKRSYYRGQIDIVFAIEFNKDTNYFSSIAESLSRDVHAYTVQVNSSDFGDSRIVIPTQTLFRDYIKIKGGENVVLMVGKIDIAALRKFQRLSYSSQMKSKAFKPVPPNFSVSEDRK